MADYSEIINLLSNIDNCLKEIQQTYPTYPTSTKKFACRPCSGDDTSSNSGTTDTHDTSEDMKRTTVTPKQAPIHKSSTVTESRGAREEIAAVTDTNTNNNHRVSNISDIHSMQSRVDDDITEDVDMAGVFDDDMSGDEDVDSHDEGGNNDNDVEVDVGDNNDNDVVEDVIMVGEEEEDDDVDVEEGVDDVEEQVEVVQENTFVTDVCSELAKHANYGNLRNMLEMLIAPEEELSIDDWNTIIDTASRLSGGHATVLKAVVRRFRNEHME